MNAWTQDGLAQQANQNIYRRYGEQAPPPRQQQQQQQPQGGGGGPMLGNVFSGNGLMGAGHAGFGGAMQGAMGQMWDVNKRNQDASLALNAMGGRGGMGGQPARPYAVPTSLGGNGMGTSQADFQRGLMNQDQERARDFAWQQRMRQQQLNNAHQYRANGFQYPGVNGGGSLGAAFTTNYGAYGNVSNPTMGGGIF